MTRRVAVVRISPDLLAEFLRGDGRRCWSSAPVDLRVRAVEWDHVSRTVRVFCESTSFAEVPDYAVAPELEVTLRTHEAGVSGVVLLGRWPNFPGATAEAIEWLITLLARLENCERAVAQIEVFLHPEGPK